MNQEELDWLMANTLPVEPEAPPRPPGQEGKHLKDPERDQQALLEAQRLNKVMGDGPMERFKRSASLGLSGPIQGAVSAVKGDGYQYGRAVDAHRGDLLAEGSGPMGTAADVLGSFAAIPTGTLPLTLAARLKQLGGITALSGGLGALRNWGGATEQQPAEPGNAALSSALTGAVAGGLGQKMAPRIGTKLPKTPSLSRVLGETSTGAAAGGMVASTLSPQAGAAIAALPIAKNAYQIGSATRGTWAPMMTSGAPLAASRMDPEMAAPLREYLIQQLMGAQ